MAQKQTILHSIDKISNSDPEYWERAYSEGRDGWDLGSSTPIFNKWINTLQSKKSICVLGAGNGWDAINFAEKGHNVTAVDFADHPIRNMKKLIRKKSLSMKILKLDIFDLPIDYSNYFDIVVEYTCFCAISPLKREKYIKTVSMILKKSALFVGILFPITPPIESTTPPYYVNLIETLNLFDKYLKKEKLDMKIESIKPRRGKESFFIYRK